MPDLPVLAPGIEEGIEELLPSGHVHDDALRSLSRLPSA